MQTDSFEMWTLQQDRGLSAALHVGVEGGLAFIGTILSPLRDCHGSCGLIDSLLICNSSTERSMPNFEPGPAEERGRMDAYRFCMAVVVAVDATHSYCRCPF
jgi:hypothetical protein